MFFQANELWDALVVNSVFEYERIFGFQLFSRMQQQDDIDPKALDLFFNCEFDTTCAFEVHMSI